MVTGMEAASEIILKVLNTVLPWPLLQKVLRYSHSASVFKQM